MNQFHHHHDMFQYAKQYNQMNCVDKECKRLVLELMVKILGDPWTCETLQIYFQEYKQQHKPKTLDQFELLVAPTRVNSKVQQRIHSFLNQVYENLRRVPGYNHTDLILTLRQHVLQRASRDYVITPSWRNKVLLDTERALDIIDDATLEPLLTPNTTMELAALVSSLHPQFNYMIDSLTQVQIDRREPQLQTIRNTLAKYAVHILDS